MTEFSSERLHALESAFGGREVLEAAHATGACLVGSAPSFTIGAMQNVGGGADGAWKSTPDPTKPWLIACRATISFNNDSSNGYWKVAGFVAHDSGVDIAAATPDDDFWLYNPALPFPKASFTLKLFVPAGFVFAFQQNGTANDALVSVTSIRGKSLS